MIKYLRSVHLIQIFTSLPHYYNVGANLKFEISQFYPSFDVHFFSFRTLMGVL